MRRIFGQLITTDTPRLIYVDYSIIGFSTLLLAAITLAGVKNPYITTTLLVLLELLL